MLKPSVAALLLAVLSLQVFAHDRETCQCPSGWNWNATPYGGVSPAQSSFKKWSVLSHVDEGSYTSSSRDDRDLGGRIFAGIDFLEHFALELGYSETGEARFRAQSDGSGFFWSAGPVHETLELSTFELSLLGKVKLGDRLALRGRVGTAGWEAKTDLSGTTQSFGPVTQAGSKDGTDLLLGAGISYSWPKVRLIAEFMRLEFDSGFSAQDVRVDTVGIAAAYLFQE